MIGSEQMPKPSKAAPFGVRWRLQASRPLRVEFTLHLGELARRAAMSRYGRMFGGRLSAVLSGRTETGPVRGHGYAHYLPEDEDGDGFVDHLTVFARDGLGGPELLALSGLEYLSWSGKSGEMGGEGGRLELKLDRHFYGGPCRLYPPARVWRSATPFVLPRHPKRHRDGRLKLNDAGWQVEGPEEQLLREWEIRRASEPALPEITRIEQLSALPLKDGNAVHWRDFALRRIWGTARSSYLAYGLEVEFSEPVSGRPVALGYAAHFGLGRFIPVS